MGTLRDQVRTLSTTLLDDEPGFENIQWSASELADFFNEGLCLTSLYRPDLFVTTQVKPLVPCKAIQEFPGCKIRKVLEFTDVNGCSIRANVSSNSWKMAAHWIGPACKSASDGGPTSAVVIEGTGAVRVEPAPPADGTIHYVRVVCQSTPPSFSGTDLDKEVDLGDCIGVVMARMWVLFRAFAKDLDSAGHMQLAQLYLNVFSNLAGAAFKSYEYFRQLDKATAK